MKKLVLNNGNEIDLIGSGTNTFGKEDNDYNGEIDMNTTELMDAISLGYRHFDTAVSYRNESVIGKAINMSNISRREFFVTSKIPGREPYIFDVGGTVKSSLEELDTDYIDLYLIHHPWDNLKGMVRVWHYLEGHVENGVLKNIGVSNFNKDELQYLWDRANIKPVVNQIESHPGMWNDDIIEFTQGLGMAVAAWSPLKGVSLEAKEALQEIGYKYGKSWAQVILRYQIERNIIVIPKSHNKRRQQENIDIFDFELTQEDKDIISKL